MKEPAKNGKDAPGAPEPKKAEQGLVKHEPKAETLELKLKETGPMTVEETIKRVNELQDNIDKREVLKSHLHAVSSLKFGEFDDRDQIILVSHTGEKYPIKSSGLCQKCSELIKNEIQEHIEEVEQFIVL